MKNIFYTALATLMIMLVSCDTEESTIRIDTNEALDLTSDAYQDSNVGVYNGVFTTNDGQLRGSIAVRIPADELTLPNASLKLSNGTNIALEASQIVFKDAVVTDLIFNSDAATSFVFSVSAKGKNPVIQDVILNNIEGSILIRKHTSRAPVVPIPGTFVCTDCGTHPVLNNSVTQTFNLLMFTTPSGDSAFDTEVTLGMNTFTGTGAQDTCVADDTETTCDISGSFAVGGAPIDWMGTHTFNNEASGPNNCSGASGTWTFDSINFGLLSGTFVSDASCLVEVTLFSENFDAFAGAGFAPTPAAGQLDSDIVIANGFSDGDVNYGDTAVTGDFARGESDGLGENTGGVYAFDVDGAGQIAMGVQPGGTDFTPGFFEYRIENTSGGALNNFTIAYDLWVNNDESRSNTFNFSYSIDGMSFTNVSSLDFASQAAANDDGFTITMQNGTFTASVADGAFIFFRFESADNGGSGFRDEFAVDNIVLTAN